MESDDPAEDKAVQECSFRTRNRTHLWPDAGCIHRQRPTNIV